ncbi:unnamed protein product [Merluccius merluccius]
MAPRLCSGNERLLLFHRGRRQSGRWQQRDWTSPSSGSGHRDNPEGGIIQNLATSTRTSRRYLSQSSAVRLCLSASPADVENDADRELGLTNDERVVPMRDAWILPGSLTHGVG